MLRELGVRDVSATSNSRRLRNACSRFAVEKLALKNTLDGHRGCVNSVLFSWDGTTIYTASDDLYVNLYDTYSEYNDSEDGKQDSIAAQQPKWRIRTKHTNNLFYARDIPHSNKGLIATCAADGRVILMNFEEGRTSSKEILRHKGRAHRLALHPHLPTNLYSCGEDGILNFIDIRLENDINEYEMNYTNFDNLYESNHIEKDQFDSKRMHTHFSTPDSVRTQSIYCISVNPSKEYEIVASGESNFVSLYDVRKFTEPVGYYSPDHLINARSSKHCSGVRYDHEGRTLIASYNDEDIYSFDVHQHLRSAGDYKSHAINAAQKPHFPDNGSRKKKQKFNVRDTGADMDDKKVGAAGRGKWVKGSGNSDEDEDADNDNDNNESSSGSEDELDEEDDRKVENSEHSEKGNYLMRFSGHRNYLTVKQVAFHGERSEVVVSGSDCGNVFIWDAETGKIMKTMFADRRGATNCIASHPNDSILATSGLEHSAKLWDALGSRVDLSSNSEAGEAVASLISTNTSSSETIRSRSNDPFHRLLAELYDNTNIFRQSNAEGAEGEDDEASDISNVLPPSLANPEDFSVFMQAMESGLQEGVFNLRDLLGVGSDDDDDDEDDDSDDSDGSDDNDEPMPGYIGHPESDEDEDNDDENDDALDEMLSKTRSDGATNPSMDLVMQYIMEAASESDDSDCKSSAEESDESTESDDNKEEGTQDDDKPESPEASMLRVTEEEFMMKIDEE